VNDPLTMPLLRAEFRLADGTTLVREWTMADVQASGSHDALKGDPPPWLLRARRKWTHPQDPITYLGDVQPGHEDDARRFLDMETSS
jgi:hypothetical protein